MSLRSFVHIASQIPLVVALALSASGCGSSRPAGAGDYSVREEANGNISILVGENASLETMIAAMTEAAEMTAWTPPETAPHLRRTDESDLGSGGTAYRYQMDHLDGRFEVYVYRHTGTVEAQVEDTQTALAQIVESGRYESATLAQPTEAQDVVWNDRPAMLHRVVFALSERGRTNDSYMYLLHDGLFWIKVRTTFPAGQASVAEADALVRGLLGV